MTHPLDGCRLKLLRAQEHFETLQGDISAFFDRSPYGLVGEFDPETDKYTFHVRVFESPPRRMSLLIGDFIHNASSALEHLAWELVRLNRCEPIERQTGFPIFTDEAKWNTMSDRMMEGMSESHRTEIDALQPFHRGDAGAFEPLALLQHLWNIDKHRTLATATVTGVSAGANFVPLRDCAVTTESEVIPGTFEDDAVVGWVRIIPEGPYPKVQMQGHTTVDVAFGQVQMTGPSLEGRSARTTLDAILTAVYVIYERFLLDFSASN